MKKPNFEKLSIAQLRSLVVTKGIKARNTWKKADFIAALSQDVKSTASKNATTKSTKLNKKGESLVSKSKTIKDIQKTKTVKSKKQIAKPSNVITADKKQLKGKTPLTTKSKTEKQDGFTKQMLQSLEATKKHTLSPKVRNIKSYEPLANAVYKNKQTTQKQHNITSLGSDASTSYLTSSFLQKVGKRLRPGSFMSLRKEVVAMTVSPKKIYAYWEVSPDVTQIDNGRLNIKVVNKKTGEFFYLPIYKSKDEKFIDVKPGGKYQVQIGKITSNGKFTPLQKSQHVNVPVETKHTLSTDKRVIHIPTSKQSKTRSVGRLPDKFFQFDDSEGSY